MNSLFKPPRISIVTAVKDRAWAIERTLRSVLDQNYPDLEYIVIDGGSTDGTLDVVRKYESRLACIISESDTGIYDALNKGFRRATGDILCWLGSDDVLLQAALAVVGEMFTRFADVRWLTTCFPSFTDRDGTFVKTIFQPGYNKDLLRRKARFKPESFYIQQESTFWRKDLWDECGGRLDDSFQYCGDYELWMRFFEKTDLVGIMRPLAAVAKHDGQKGYGQIAHGEWSKFLDPWIRSGPGLLPPYLSLRRYKARVIFWNAATRSWQLNTTKLSGRR